MISLDKNSSFKTIQIVFWFKEDLKLETMGYRFLLAKLLSYYTDKFPTPKLLNEKLSYLYGTRIVDNVKTIKDKHYICYVLTLPDPEILDEKDLLKDVLELFKEMIYNRFHFSEKHFTYLKKVSLETIDKIKEDKNSYSKLKYHESIYKNHPFGQLSTGPKEIIANLTESDLYQYYLNHFLKNDLIITVNGNLSLENQDLITSLFNTTPQLETINLNHFGYPIEASIKEEIIPMQQALIYIGYYSHVSFYDPLYEAMQLLTIIIGGYPESRLFKQIREEHMLAYDISADYDFDKALLTLYAGVDASEKDNATQKMLKIMEDVMDYGITYEELHKAKAYLKGMIYASLDYQITHSIDTFFQIVHGIYHTLEQRLDKIDQVDLSMITEALNTLRLTKIYILYGGETDE